MRFRCSGISYSRFTLRQYLFYSCNCTRGCSCSCIFISPSIHLHPDLQPSAWRFANSPSTFFAIQCDSFLVLAGKVWSRFLLSTWKEFWAAVVYLHDVPSWSISFFVVESRESIQMAHFILHVTCLHGEFKNGATCCFCNLSAYSVVSSEEWLICDRAE